MILFVTNRVLKQGPTPINSDGSPALPRQISFELDNNQAEQYVYFCQRKGINDYIEIGNQAFFNQLKNANAQQILLYIHGYSNLPEDSIFQRTDELQALCDQKRNGYVSVIPLIWPCDNDRKPVEDYFDDQIAADASDVAFMRLFEKFLKWRGEHSTGKDPCSKRINLLAHSMGNRVLRGALKSAARYYQRGGIPLIFRNIFMAAADVVNETLEFGQEGQFIPQAARNVIVYYAADDLALRASKVANLNNAVASRRLGHTGPERIDKVAKNVCAFDCDDFNIEYDPPVGHGYFARDPQGNPGILFNHMWQSIESGRVPMKSPDSRIQILNVNSGVVN